MGINPSGSCVSTAETNDNGMEIEKDVSYVATYGPSRNALRWEAKANES